MNYEKTIKHGHGAAGKYNHSRHEHQNDNAEKIAVVVRVIIS